MAIVKGSGQNFSKKPTNIGIPVVTQPKELITALALTGNGDMDENTPETLYFHVFGGVPGDIRLYIYGEEFSPFHYSELPQHNHGPGSYQSSNVNSGSTTHAHGNTFSINNTNLSHGHSYSMGSDSHRHRVWSIPNTPTALGVLLSSGSQGWYDAAPGNGHQLLENDSHSHSLTIYNNLGNHSHGISGGITNNSINSHQHAVSSGSSSNTGLVGPAALNTVAVKDYFDDLQIEVDGVDRTATLKTQAGVAKFGDGTAGHSIVTTGIELQLGSFISTPGQHKIVFSLGGSQNGGKLRYNLYLLA